MIFPFFIQIYPFFNNNPARKIILQWNAEIRMSEKGKTEKNKCLILNVQALKFLDWKQNVRLVLLRPKWSKCEPILIEEQKFVKFQLKIVQNPKRNCSDFGHCPNTELSGAGPKVKSPRTELVWISAFHCTICFGLI